MITFTPNRFASLGVIHIQSFGLGFPCNIFNFFQHLLMNISSKISCNLAKLQRLTFKSVIWRRRILYFCNRLPDILLISSGFKYTNKLCIQICIYTILYIGFFVLRITRPIFPCHCCFYLDIPVYPRRPFWSEQLMNGVWEPTNHCWFFHNRAH